MDYEKKYKEALEKAKTELRACGSTDCDAYRQITRLFPELAESEEVEISFGAKDSELIEETYYIPKGMEAVIQEDKVIIKRKESEDERIKKEITAAVNLYCTEYSRGTKVRNDMLTWLKKQKPMTIPKFRPNDYVVSTKNPRLTYKVLEVGNVNELGNLEYRVEIFTDGKSGIGNEPHNIHNIECSKMDGWARLVPQKYSLEQAAEVFLGALSKTPYNNKPVTDAQVITKELLKFLSDPKAYNPNAVNEQKFVCEKDIDKIVFDKLTHSLGYPCDTNGNIPTYQETFDTCKNALIYWLQEKVKGVIIEKSISLSSNGVNTETLLKDSYMQAYKEGIEAATKLLSSQINQEILEKQKDCEAEIEKAYKNADEVQYRRGYEDGVKSVGWTEEDENRMNDALRILSFSINFNFSAKEEVSNWLYALKERLTN